MSDANSKATSLGFELVAGSLAGAVSTLLAHPLDLVKTRLQVNRRQDHQKYGASFTIFKEAALNQGTKLAIYRGLTPNLLGNTFGWAFFFLFYAELKRLLSDWRGSTAQLTPFDYFSSSGLAGMATALCTNPIWVIKTRMLATSASHPGAYQSIAQGAREIATKEGLRGFYSGLLPSLFGISQGALQFVFYESLKRGLSVPGEHLSTRDCLTASATAKILSSTITYPYQVIRARLQMYPDASGYSGLHDTIRSIWLRDGPRGFYRGLGPNILRVVPSTCITFIVYERTMAILRTSDSDRLPGT